MKGKTLVRIGAALTALCMLGTMSAFADAPDFQVEYDKTNNQLLLTNISNASTGDSTFLAYDISAITAAFTDAPTYDTEGVGDIFYIDQLKLDKTTATLKLAAAGSKASKIVLGMGGEGIGTPRLKVIKIALDKDEIQEFEKDESDDWITTRRALIGVTKSSAMNLPTALTAKVLKDSSTGTKKEATVPLEYTGWKIKDTGAAFDFAAIDVGTYVIVPAVDLSDYTLAADVSLPEITIEATKTVKITNWTISTDPILLPAATATLDDIKDELASTCRATVNLETSADFSYGRGGRRYAFTWELEDASDADKIEAKTPGDYAFVGTFDKALPNAGSTDAQKELLNSITFNVADAMTATPPRVIVTLTQKPDVNITKVTLSDKAGAPVSGLDSDDNLTISTPVPNNTEMDDLMDADTGVLPYKLKVSAVDSAEVTTIPEEIIFTVNSWEIISATANGEALESLEYDPKPTDDTTYVVKPHTERTRLESTEYVFKLVDTSGKASNCPEFFPTVTFTVKGLPTIDDVTTTSVKTTHKVTAGTDEATDLKNTTNFPTKLPVATVDGVAPASSLTVNVSWKWDKTYNANEPGTYVATGTITAPSDAYKLASTIQPIIVTVTVGDAAPEVVPYGDVDGNGRIDGNDATKVWQYFRKKLTLSSALQTYNTNAEKRGESAVDGEMLEKIMNVDPSGNGRIDGNDATKIWQYFRKKISTFPAQQ